MRGDAMGPYGSYGVSGCTGNAGGTIMKWRGEIVCASIALLASVGAAAQPAYPASPIRMIVPFPPGGANDIVTRLVTDGIAAGSKGWIFVVENKPGAGGDIRPDILAEK